MSAVNLGTRGVEELACRWAVEELFPLWAKPDSPVIDTRAFRQAELVQRTFGDYFLTLKSGEVVSVEVKGERRHTGNLFLESWSNLTADNTYRRDGWLFTLRADIYLNVFLDQEVAYAMRFADLRRWALEEGNAYRFPERPVHLFLSGGQRNNTVGFLVPVDRIRDGILVREYRRSGGVWQEVTRQTAERQINLR